MPNPIPKSVHFLDYLTFGVTLWFFPQVSLLELVQLHIGSMLLNIELAKFE